MKKNLCLLLCCLLTVSFVIPAYALCASAANDVLTETVATKDVATGVVVYEEVSFTRADRVAAGSSSAAWFPSSTMDDMPASSAPLAPTALGDNDDPIRVTDTEVAPYSAICYLETEWPDGVMTCGTAFLVGQNVAATAGHNLYDSEHGGWATRVRVWPGKDGYGVFHNPYGTVDCTMMRVSSSWTGSSDPNHDWGVMELDENVGLETGWFGYSYAHTVTNQVGLYVTLSGYPISNRYYQYKHSGVTASATAYRLTYPNIDASVGMSGSPVYIASQREVYAIHVDTNGGVRITEYLYNYIHGVING